MMRAVGWGLGVGLVALAPTSAQDEQRPWWHWAVAGSLQETAGDWTAALESLLRATELEADWAYGWFELGRAAVEAGEFETAEWALERVSDEPGLAAHARFQRARAAAGAGDEATLREQLALAREVEVYVPVKDLRRDELLAPYRKRDWFRDFERSMGDPQERYEALADAGDVDGLADLFRGLELLWTVDDHTPAYLLQGTLAEIVRLRAKGGADPGRVLALEQRAACAARAGDRLHSGDVWTRWVESVAGLDQGACDAYLDTWKAIGGTVKMFRGHRFTSIMQRFEPALEVAERSGDALGALEVKFVLGLARECLVEYSVKGVDPAVAWRAGWEDFEQVRERATQLGIQEYVVDAYENRVEYFALAPDEAIRGEFCDPQDVGRSLIEMALQDMRMPIEERCLGEYRGWLESYGIYP